MVNILTTYGLKALVVAEVVLAIGQAELASSDGGDDHFAVLQIVLAADPKQWRGSEIGEVCDFSDQRRAIVDGIDAIELRLNRCDASLIDRRLVHARGVEVAYLLLSASFRRRRGSSGVFFEDGVQNLPVTFRQLLESPVA